MLFLTPRPKYLNSFLNLKCGFVLQSNSCSFDKKQRSKTNFSSIKIYILKLNAKNKCLAQRLQSKTKKNHKNKLFEDLNWNFAPTFYTFAEMKSVK